MGGCCAALISVGFPYANLVIRGTRPANTSLPFGAVAVLFLVAAVLNPLLRRLSHRGGMDRDDLLVVSVMVLLASAVPTWGMVGQLLPIMTGAQYYATPENDWEALFVAQTPEWLAPTDPEVSRQFYEGLSPGAGIPWRAWAVPLLAWALMIGGVYVFSIGLMLLLRKPWVDEEHLIFPLMRLPLEMVEDVGPTGTLSPLFRDKLMWLGFAAVLVPTALNGLHHHVPGVPLLNLRHNFSIPIHHETVFVRLWVNFAVIGFAYVVSADLAFGLWSFALLSAIQTPLMRLWGVGLGAHEIYCAGSPAVSNQAMGAMIFLVAYGFWLTRAHQSRLWRAALSGHPDPSLSNEPASPRVTVVALLAGAAVMLAWLGATGLPLLAAAVFILATFVNFLALTRATVQGGVPVSRAALIPQSFTAYTLGSRALGGRGLASLAYAFSWTADIRVFLMPFFAHSLKLWGEQRTKRRGMLVATAMAIVLAALGGVITTLYFAYTRGGVSLSAWLFRGCPLSAFRYSAAQMATPALPSPGRWGFLALGATAMWLLTTAQYRLTWWPFHPLGFAIGPTQPMQDLWFSVFLGWVAKSVTLRYGGYKAYRAALPAFLGIILGQALGCTAWLIVDGILGATGNMVYVY